MFFNVFFMFGGSGTLLVAMAFSVGEKADELRNSVLRFDETLLRIVLCGTSVSVGMYVSWLKYFTLMRSSLTLNIVYNDKT